jgi:hypothetical protein
MPCKASNFVAIAFMIIVVGFFLTKGFKGFQTIAQNKGKKFKHPSIFLPTNLNHL